MQQAIKKNRRRRKKKKGSSCMSLSIAVRVTHLYLARSLKIQLMQPIVLHSFSFSSLLFSPVTESMCALIDFASFTRKHRLLWLLWLPQFRPVISKVHINSLSSCSLFNGISCQFSLTLYFTLSLSLLPLARSQCSLFEYSERREREAFVLSLVPARVQCHEEQSIAVASKLSLRMRKGTHKQQQQQQEKKRNIAAAHSMFTVIVESAQESPDSRTLVKGVIVHATGERAAAAAAAVSLAIITCAIWSMLCTFCCGQMSLLSLVLASEWPHSMLLIPQEKEKRVRTSIARAEATCCARESNN